jgi:glycosyltransferase involved in cell wall biosynthesis
MKNEQIVISKKKLYPHRTINSFNQQKSKKTDLPEVLFITSFPPIECGIATYSRDLITSLQNKFKQSYHFSICSLESSAEFYSYKQSPDYILNTSDNESYIALANRINENKDIKIVFLQHDFTFFNTMEKSLIALLEKVRKEVVVTFHTVLPNPDAILKDHVQQLASLCESIIVMTNISADILKEEYGVSPYKITVIPHGTHLFDSADKSTLKEKYKLSDKKVLATFGLLSSVNNIETTLAALPAIVKKNPEVMFLILGKTRHSIVKNQGEAYRELLVATVNRLHLENNVRFINQYLPLDELLEYLQLSDIYLFTSKNRSQAVSGTFSYAISCGCPIISTPIPHAREVLNEDMGIIIDFEAPEQLAFEVNRILNDKIRLENLSTNGFHKMASTAWENSAIAHANLFEKVGFQKRNLQFELPEINLNHILKMTTDFGMIQFSKINKPDSTSGYRLDDNARAMIALCAYYEFTKDESVLKTIVIYLTFIEYCLQPNGKFLNYLNKDKEFITQNLDTNLEDANGRAIWSLGSLIATKGLPIELKDKAKELVLRALPEVRKMNSTRAIAYSIKGLSLLETDENSGVTKELANRIVQMYFHEADKNWKWPESFFTYGNSVIPEALLYAWLATGETIYRSIAKKSFDFLLSKIFKSDCIQVISNKEWSHRETTFENPVGGQQPIDVAYTILALDKFYTVFGTESYRKKMRLALNWFLGENQLHQIIYNPKTGGCYGGLEEHNVNLNQGAESTLSYCMARLVLEKEMYKN